MCGMETCSGAQPGGRQVHVPVLSVIPMPALTGFSLSCYAANSSHVCSNDRPSDSARPAGSSPTTPWRPRSQRDPAGLPEPSPDTRRRAGGGPVTLSVWSSRFCSCSRGEDGHTGAPLLWPETGNSVVPFHSLNVHLRFLYSKFSASMA